MCIPVVPGDGLADLIPHPYVRQYKLNKKIDYTQPIELTGSYVC